MRQNLYFSNNAAITQLFPDLLENVRDVDVRNIVPIDFFSLASIHGFIRDGTSFGKVGSGETELNLTIQRL
jgi:hypothetical protein